LTLNLGRSGQ